MEVMGLDPHQGYIFYTLQMQRAKGQPELVRRGIECLSGCWRVDLEQAA